MIEKIDEGIRELILVLNQLPGIKTLQSCSGHSSDMWAYTEGYVAFTAETQDNLINLLKRLPFERDNITFSGNEYYKRRLDCSCNYSQNMRPNQIVYNLAFGGQPVFNQRLLIVELTQVMKNSHLPKRQGVSTTRESSHILDISPEFHPIRSFQNLPYPLPALWTQVYLLLDTLSLFLASYHLTIHYKEKESSMSTTREQNRFEYNRPIWNNREPDVAVLYNNQGEEVSRKSY